MRVLTVKRCTTVDQQRSTASAAICNSIPLSILTRSSRSLESFKLNMETFHFKSFLTAKSYLVHLTTSRASPIQAFSPNHVRVISSSFYPRTTAALRPALYAHYGSRFGFSARHVAPRRKLCPSLAATSVIDLYSVTAVSTDDDKLSVANTKEFILGV